MTNRKRQKTSNAPASHSDAIAEPIDLTVDTPPKLLNKNAPLLDTDDDIIITQVVPPPAVVITSYTPAEKSQTSVLSLMANIMEKVNTHNLRHSPPRTANVGPSQIRRPVISPKKPNNNPAKVFVAQESDPGPPTAIRCAICLSSFSKDVELSATVCGHIFCQDCIGAALKKGKKVCPVCRKDLKGKTAVHRLYI